MSNHANSCKVYDFPRKSILTKKTVLKSQGETSTVVNPPMFVGDMAKVKAERALR